MSVAERTSAIYREMRRTDAERTKREQGSSGKDADVRVSASDPTYIWFCLSPARQVIGCLGIDAADPQEAWDEAHDRWKDLAAADVIEVLLDGRVVHRHHRLLDQKSWQPEQPAPCPLVFPRPTPYDRT